MKCVFWSKKNIEQPREVFKSSGKKYWFDCKCGHEFESSLNSISTNNSWCAFCTNQRLCENNDCKLCLEKSFSSHLKCIFWSKKNIKQPREVFKSSHSKYWFECEKNHKFESALNKITCGRWCPKCNNKTETKFYEKIIQFYPAIITQYKQEWCKNITYLPFDFCIIEYNIIIELDGEQHFKQVSNWLSPEENFENDKYKEKCANENGYSIIRIVQEDVWNDKYDWFKEICDIIENIKNEKKVVNIYLCKNNEYYNYGLGLKSEATYHRKSSTGCEVEMRDLQENVLKTYETIAKAASMEKICSTKMSLSIRDKTIINGQGGGDYYFCKAPKNVIKLN